MACPASSFRSRQQQTATLSRSALQAREPVVTEPPALADAFCHWGEREGLTQAECDTQQTLGETRFGQDGLGRLGVLEFFMVGIAFAATICHTAATDAPGAPTSVATADQVKALIRSHADGDDTRFYAVAIQVAAQAARSGHGKFSQDLRELVDQVKARAKALEPSRGPKPVPLAQPRGELAGLLTACYPKTLLADMALPNLLRSRLERVLLEQRERGRLREHGFSPIRKLLLVGPPGTGKTMTASALAGELGLPLFSIQLDGLITKYMGETAAKLRLVFDAIQSTRGVYLFDEFDALGVERSSTNDVGEIRRVLNSFLQFLEQDYSDSIVLGATNHVGLLDRALFRRFDALLEYSLPSSEVATHVMRGRLALLDTSNIEWPVAARAADGLSHAEIAMACEQAAKNAILDNTTVVRAAGLVTAFKERHGTHA